MSASTKTARIAQRRYLLGVQIPLLARHVFRQGKGRHLPRHRRPDHLFQRVFRMTAKLPGMTVMGERHPGGGNEH